MDLLHKFSRGKMWIFFNNSQISKSFVLIFFPAVLHQEFICFGVFFDQRCSSSELTVEALDCLVRFYSSSRILLFIFFEVFQQISHNLHFNC